MLLLPTLLLVSGQFNNLTAPGSNGSLATSFYIVSTSESRVPGAAIYMHDDFQNTCGDNGRRLQDTTSCGNILQSAMHPVGSFATACVCTSCTSCASSYGLTIEGVEYNDPLQYARTLIIPVPDSPDHYYLVGSDYSPLRGWSAYAAGVPGDVVSTMIDAEIYNDVSPAARGQWRIIPSELSSDGLAYHIVSAASAEAPDEMIYLEANLNHGQGRAFIWAYDSTDTRALWRILPAPPSPPIDYSTIEDTRGRAMARILSWLPMAIGIPVFGGCGLLVARNYYKRWRERQARDSHGIPMQPVAPVVAQAVPGAVPVAQAVPMP